MDAFNARGAVRLRQSPLLAGQGALDVSLDVDPVRLWLTSRDLLTLRAFVGSFSSGDQPQPSVVEAKEPRGDAPGAPVGFGHASVAARVRGLCVCLLSDGDVPLTRVVVGGLQPQADTTVLADLSDGGACAAHRRWH